MMSSLKSEIYKIISIRSTYVLVGLATALILLLAGYGEGFKFANTPLDENKFSNVALAATQVIGLLLAVIAVIHITNEYRQNTINYTLTAASSRTKVLLAKTLSISIFSVAFTLFITVVVISAVYVGMQIAGAPDLPTQNFPLSILGKVVFYNLGLSLLAMVVSIFLRSIAGALVLILFGFTVVEGLLSLLLKTNASYLPMSSLQLVVGEVAVGEGPIAMSPSKAMVVFSLNIVAMWLVAWYTFVRRDAN